jgi:hydroxymethylbilane synthase
MPLLRQKAATVQIGTSSLRRTAQLQRLFPGCRVTSLRGNIDTRLRKVSEGVVDAAVLAAAGLIRLGRDAEIGGTFAPEDMLPAPGQGALAVEIRADDAELRSVVRSVHCPATAACVAAERAFMAGLGGGCQLPVGALAAIAGDVLRLRGRVLSLAGDRVFEGAVEGAGAEAAAHGSRLAHELIAQGADRLIRDIEDHLRREQERG